MTGSAVRIDAEADCLNRYFCGGRAAPRTSTASLWFLPADESAKAAIAGNEAGLNGDQDRLCRSGLAGGTEALGDQKRTAKVVPA